MNPNSERLFSGLLYFALVICLLGCQPKEEKSANNSASSQPGTEERADDELPALSARVNNEDSVGLTARGQGDSEESAINDAFRNAVQQVVGVLIDSETMIKNDELIEDKILTYSHGFIESWKKLKTRQENGIHSVTINAVVRRRDIVLRLKEFQIQKTTLVDGNALYEATKNKLAIDNNRRQTRKKANELFQQAIKDLPQLLSADVQEKPNYDADKAQLQLVMKLRIDAIKYAIFQERLVAILEEIALAKTTVLTTGSLFDRDRNVDSYYRAFQSWDEKDPRGRQTLFLNTDLAERYSKLFLRDSAFTQAFYAPDKKGADAIPWIFKVPNENFLYHQEAICTSQLQQQASETWCLWVCKQTQLSKISMRWHGYLLDADLRPLLAWIADDGLSYKLGVEARNETGEIISELDFPVSLRRWSIGPSRIFPSILINVMDPTGRGPDVVDANGKPGRPHVRTELIGHAAVGRDGYKLSALVRRWDQLKTETKLQYNVFISPFILGQLPAHLEHFPVGNFQVFPEVKVGIEYPCELETLKRVKSFKVTVKHFTTSESN